MANGWYNEPIRHGLARKGLKTGRKNELTTFHTIPVKRKDTTPESKDKSKVVSAEFRVIDDRVHEKGRHRKSPTGFTKKFLEKLKSDEHKELRKKLAREEKVALAGRKFRRGVKRTAKKVGKGTVRALSKATSIAESLTPERPRIKHEVDVLGSKGVSIKRIDIGAEEKRRREALQKAKQTVYFKQA